MAFDGFPVRVASDDGGICWFAAVDVARVLGLTHVGSMLRPLDADERGVRIEHTPAGMGQVATVSEAGVYKLIARSRKASAKLFDRWVRHEVLPKIRATGGFGQRNLRDPRQMVQLAAELAALAAEQQAEIAEMRPRAEGFDRLADGSGSMTITEAAKALQVAPRALGEELRECRWCYRIKEQGPWLGYQAIIDAGLLEHKVRTLEHPQDPALPGKVVTQVRVTAKGLARLATMLGSKVIGRN